MRTRVSFATDVGITRGFKPLAQVVVLGFAVGGMAAAENLGLDSLLGTALSNPPSLQLSTLPNPSSLQLTTFPESAAWQSANAELKIAIALFKSGEFAAALAKAEDFVAKEPTSTLAFQLIGMCRLRLGQFEAGISALQTAASFSPQSTESLVAIANAFMIRGSLEEARKYFNLVLEKRADNPGAHQGLGLISEREKKYEQAAFHFEAAAKGMPAVAVGVKLNLAVIYNRERQFDKTIALLAGPAQEAGPVNVSALEMLAIAYLGSGRPAEAVKNYELAYAAAPSAQLALGLGISLRSINRLPESLKFIKEATTSRANWSPAWVQMAETQIAMADYSAALGSLEKGRAFTTDTVTIDARVGEVYLLLKDYPKAIAKFEVLAAMKEAGIADFDRLGTAYQASGDMAAAERTLKKAQVQFPASFIPPYKLGLLYGALGRHAESVTEFSSAAALDTENLALQRALILSHSRAGNRPRAIELAESLVKKHPAAPDPKLLLASLYSQSSDDRRAAEIYREMLKTMPDHVIALNNLAMILGRKGEFEEAIRFSQRAVELLPQSGQILDTLGWLTYQKGDFAEAARRLKKASELSPEDASILFHLGMAHAKQNEKAAALKAFKSAVALSKVFPEYQQATQMIASLGGGL